MVETGIGIVCDCESLHWSGCNCMMIMTSLSCICVFQVHYSVKGSGPAQIVGVKRVWRRAWTWSIIDSNLEFLCKSSIGIKGGLFVRVC